MGALRSGLLVVTLLASASLSSCAVTSSLEVPSCVDRLEVGGQHARRGRVLFFDHSFDPPMSKTQVTLTSGDRTEVVDIWNGRPDGGRLLVGAVLGIFGGALLASAAYDVSTNQASIVDEGPFYSALVGTGALGVGGLLALTGWHPATSADLSQFCREP